jgi:copper transport protein
LTAKRGSFTRLIVVVALTAAAFGWTLATASPSSAHALVKTSDPAAGATLATSPPQVLLTFTEAPDPRLSSVQVLDSTGRTVSTAKAQPVPGNQEQLVLPLPKLREGAYTAAWRTLSKVDGHVVAGSFSFGVGTTVPPGTTQSATTTSQPVRPAAAAGRWALDWGLILLMGAGVIGATIVRGFAPGHRALLIGAWCLAAVGLTVQIVAESSAAGVSVGTLLASGAGHEEVRLAFALLPPLAMAIIALARPRPESMAFLGVATAVALLAVALSGHAAAESPEWLQVGVQFLHLVAVGIWIGGLAWLLLAIRGAPSEERRASVRAFSSIALYALAVTVATGIGRAWVEVGGWHALFDTSFGIALLVKSSFVVVLVALGALNRYRNVPRMEAPNPRMRRVRRTVGWEVVVAVAVLAATAVLAELPPSVYVAAATAKQAAPPSITVRGSDFATTARVRLMVSPGYVGANRFTLAASDFDTGKPVPARSISLRFEFPARPDLGASMLDLKRASNTAWQAQGSQLSIDGTWSVTAVIQEASGAVEVPLKVRTRLPPEQIQVSTVPGQPALYTITLPTGGTLQTYIDPGTPGPNQVHFTFFTAAGAEQPITSATASSTDPSGAQRPMKLIRFDPGHFVANAALSAGRWTFRIDATTNRGQPVTAYFSQTIGGSS